MSRSSPIGLSLCSWNANGLLKRRIELRIFIEKHCPDIILIQETHLRLSHSFNIANYSCYRNDRITEDCAAGGTLILIKNNIKHYHLPTLQLQAIEATIVFINLPNHNPISIVSCYIPPYSDTNIFTIDLENHIQTSSDCIIFGDLNATHSAWNCTHNSTRGNKLLDFTNLLNLNIAYPNSPTRFGHGTANTIDIAIIRNFYYPFDFFTTPDLSSDHNPVYLNFKLKTPIYSKNPRDIFTCWSEYTNNLNKNLSLFDYHPNNIQNSTDIDNKIKNFTSTILATHSHASRPIGNQHRSYTPPHIHQLIQHRNRLRKQYHRTLSPAHETELNNLLKIHLNNTPSTHGLNAQDNSLWHTQKLFKNKRQAIPPLECDRGTAITGTQKANLLADTLKDNFTENTYQNRDTNNHINNTVNIFISTNPTTFLNAVLPDEIITYIKKSSSIKAPGKDGVTNRMIKNFPIKAIFIY
ncbi:probable RNA-directed DNA polymerase from transposon X-element [Trichonephila clavipes]|nr:probable RNA-directed DNA polymerase from transposon X-element [Trichonephila clavipes]